MSVADLNPWVIVPAVILLCVIGVALGFTLSPRTKSRIGDVFAVPIQLLLSLMPAATSYSFLVDQRRLGEWSFAIWVALVGLGAIGFIRYLMKMFSDQSQGPGTHA